MKKADAQMFVKALGRVLRRLFHQRDEMIADLQRRVDQLEQQLAESRKQAS